MNLNIIHIYRVIASVIRLQRHLIPEENQEIGYTRR